MIRDVLALVIIIFLGFSPILVMIWGLHYLARHPRFYPRHPRNRRSQDSTTTALTRLYLPQQSLILPRRPLSWLEPMGYLGDTSCRFNAHSSFVRCAVNPCGPCQGCTYYETSTHLTEFPST